MEILQSSERVPLEFKDIRQATDWTLDHLAKDRKKRLWLFRNKFQKAKTALAQGDWQPSQSIIQQAYRDASDVLENARINLALHKPHEVVPQSAPITRRAAFFAILLNLIDQQARLGGEFNPHDISKKGIDSSDRLLATREYQVDFGSYTVPQSLRELSSLAQDIFKS